MSENMGMNCNLAVIGLGRIGLPLSMNAVSKGFRVLGVDTNEKTISKLLLGEVPFTEKGMEAILKKSVGLDFFPALSNNLSSNSFSSIKYIMIAVGVHNINRRYPEPFEYKSIERVIHYLYKKKCLENRLIILRPTQPIGSTSRVKEIIQKKYGLIEGDDYYLAYMPERIVEGNALEEEQSLPKIVGTFSDKSFEIISQMLIPFNSKVKRVSSPEVAEFVKLLDNSWRHTRFAFANDAALAAESAGIDVMEAINTANFEYPRNSIAMPGPVSGYCLGKDPYIFEYAFRKTESVRKFNSLWYYSILSSKYLLDHVISKVVGNKVLIMGLSFKKNIDDYRLSHGISLVKKLIEKGYSVSIIDKDYRTNDYTLLDSIIEDKVIIMKSLQDLNKEDRYESVIISVNNDEFYNQEKILAKHGKIIDLWNIYKDKKNQFTDYWALGLGHK